MNEIEEGTGPEDMEKLLMKITDLFAVFLFVLMNHISYAKLDYRQKPTTKPNELRPPLMWSYSKTIQHSQEMERSLS
jgi:hypothetical protein